ncbi:MULTISPECIES: helix-turn-helix transcriptional regulator [Protofrankia]|uniref:ArsR/SmtB family transcription factor n=1 Tax=Protofrankia TaxID=2994361 RepID=UPI00064094A5|nr:MULTISPECIES: metalloregulator ArsR/SmtB family transcription factor [Protofrankia]ONH34735.1 MarR family transcriptional regulator [Protofrankia sp. BMG5.30]
MHRIAPGRSAKVIDGDRACDAAGAVADRARIQHWAARFAILADPGRLAILLAVRHAGPISVSDLAAGVGMNDTAVSQALRILRYHAVVSPHRDGRVIRYTLSDSSIVDLLDGVHPAPALAHNGIAHPDGFDEEAHPSAPVPPTG